MPEGLGPSDRHNGEPDERDTGKRNAYSGVIWALVTLLRYKRTALAIVMLPACAIAAAKILLPSIIGGHDPGELQSLTVRLTIVAVECFAFALIARQWVGFVYLGEKLVIASIWAPIIQILATLYFLLRIILMFAFGWSSAFVFSTGLADLVPLSLIVVPVLLPLALIAFALRFMVLLPPAAIGQLQHGFSTAYVATRGQAMVLFLSTILIFVPFLLFRLATETGDEMTLLSLGWRVMKTVLDAFVLCLTQCVWLAMLVHIARRLGLLPHPEPNARNEAG